MTKEFFHEIESSSLTDENLMNLLDNRSRFMFCTLNISKLMHITSLQYKSNISFGEVKISDSNKISNDSILEYTNNLSGSNNDDSISYVAAFHQQTFDPKIKSVVEFQIDDEQWTYCVMCTDIFSYVLFNGKTKSVKNFIQKPSERRDPIYELFKDARSITFTFIKLNSNDILNIKKSKSKENLNSFEKFYKDSFIYELLDMLFYENKVLESIAVDGTLNVHGDLFKKIVQYYFRDQNKENRKQIMVELRNLILEFDPEFKLTAYFEVADGSFISFNEVQAMNSLLYLEEERSLDDSNKTIEINDSDVSKSE